MSNIITKVHVENTINHEALRLSLEEKGVDVEGMDKFLNELFHTVRFKWVNGELVAELKDVPRET